MEIKYHTFDITSGGKLTCPILTTKKDIQKIARIYDFGIKGACFEDWEYNFANKYFFDEFIELFRAEIITADFEFFCLYLVGLGEDMESFSCFLAIRKGAFKK